MKRFYKIYLKIKDDIMFSIKNEEEIGLKDYLRVSSKSSFAYRYLFIPILILGIFFSTKYMIYINHNSDTAFGKEFANIFNLFYIIIFIIFMIIFHELLLLHNAFVNKTNNEILFFDKVRDRKIIINENNFEAIKCERVTNMDIITIKYKELKHIRKIYFIAKFRFLKVFDEHNIVIEIEDMFYKEDY